MNLRKEKEEATSSNKLQVQTLFKVKLYFLEHNIHYLKATGFSAYLLFIQASYYLFYFIA